MIEALRDAGRGDWFAVVERSGLDHVTKERQLVRTTFESYNKNADGKTILKPLIYAGMLIEGGIIGSSPSQYTRWDYTLEGLKKSKRWSATGEHCVVGPCKEIRYITHIFYYKRITNG